MILGVMFIIFAALQYNDPDPWLWIAIYMAVGLIAIFSAMGKYQKWLTLAVGLVSIIWMIILFPGLWQWITEEPADALLYGMSPDKMYIEESREFIGLLMGLGGLYYIFRQNQKKAAA